jgi:hypothetical protein
VFDELAGQAQEQLLPDSIIAQANLDGVVGDIVDDPYNPDAAWLTSATDTPHSVRVSFPTPSAPPQDGADLQEFRILVEK